MAAKPEKYIWTTQLDLLPSFFKDPPAPQPSPSAMTKLKQPVYTKLCKVQEFFLESGAQII